MILLATLTVAPPIAAQPQPTLPQSDLVIQTAKGPQRFRVELADNDQSRARGMMFRTSMAPDAGMLFDFRQEQMASFWMRNTLLPLDMLFIKADGTILNIHQRAIPRDETGINSVGPVRAVLEVNGGTTARLGIKAGDKVEHAIFGNTPRK
ncbi:DUF192 domain-containing protein [Ferrovibrio terrae]|uniref:DUF192 domain-containing protein n=1 Tax=Ferrovibrio terrae TaxID=2594003 RepID=A0A516H4R3_9PROT|nr:DUF192 domain-containing protein [Ferrovibrio terrae]QDO98745.1 DUF192 domain-containing protein [Ferrovibrio terrae]